MNQIKIVFLIIIFSIYQELLAYEVPRRQDLTAQILSSCSLDTDDRLVLFSRLFLGAPYQPGCLGEGPTGQYDQDPLYRFDAFDCTTYVETCLALANARDFEDFSHIINEIRYFEGEISFITRKHFPCLDWIPGNAAWLEDWTWVVGEHDEDQVKVAWALVKKRNWYRAMTLEAIRLVPREGEPEADFEKRRHEAWHLLKEEGQAFDDAWSTVPYLTLDAIEKKPALLENIPQGAVINVVRPNWDIEKAIGTRLNISHQGLAVWKNGQLFFRHASAHAKVNKVVEEPLEEVLKKYKQQPTIKGINILRSKSAR